MAANGTSSGINRVLILGDNRLAESIVHGLAHSNLEVHQTTHPQSTLEPTHHGVQIHKIDSSPTSLTDLITTLNPDIIFSTYAPGSFSTQMTLIDSAIAAGVPRFVLAEWAQDTLNPKIQERLLPYRERAQTLQYIQSQHHQISFLGIATGLNLPQALASGNLGFDMKYQTASFPSGTGDVKFVASSSEWPGRIALSIIEHWEEIKNGYVYAPSMVISANEILQCLGQGWESMPGGDVEELLQEAEKRFERGFPDAGMFLTERSVVFDKEVDAVKPFIEKDAKARLGLEGEKVDDVVARVLQDFNREGKGGDCGCE